MSRGPPLGADIWIGGGRNWFSADFDGVINHGAGPNDRLTRV